MSERDWEGLSRRALFGAGIGLAATTALRPAETLAQGNSGRDASHDINMRSDGTYDTVPLTKNNWALGVMQSRVISVDTANPAPDRRANVRHMMDLIDYASGFSGPKDLLFFHEFPITGYNYQWNLEEARRVAIEIPGEETEMLGQKAREYGTWLVFGSYVRDPDWPDSLLSITTVMNDRGEIVDKHWKARNIKGIFTFELFTTSIYDVLDRYVEIYGWDHVIPITRHRPITGCILKMPAVAGLQYMRPAAMKWRRR